MKKVETEKENSAKAPKKPFGDAKPNGVMVFVSMTDGSIRSAQITQMEHAHTIMNILTMNEKKGLLLSEEDYSEALRDFISEEPQNPESEEPQNPESDDRNIN